MQKVLFVCLGNICRSPAAHGIFQSLVDSKNLSDQFMIESAGTSAHHVGERADKRMRKAASYRGLEIESRSLLLTKKHLEEFDLIIAMDNSNYHNILKLDPVGEFHSKVHKMCDYLGPKFSQIIEIPDPYYGGDQGFEDVLDLLEDACRKLLLKVL